jgi:hypothetical protein
MLLKSLFMGSHFVEKVVKGKFHVTPPLPLITCSCRVSARMKIFLARHPALNGTLWIRLKGSILF